MPQDLPKQDRQGEARFLNQPGSLTASGPARQYRLWRSAYALRYIWSTTCGVRVIGNGWGRHDENR